MRFTSLLPMALTALAIHAAPTRAPAGPLSPAIVVNDSAVTSYELDQRLKFLKILGSDGDLATEAREGLIEDRLRMDAAKAAGIVLGPQQIANGMQEFAGRAELSTEEFLKIIGDAGVAPETFRDFVQSGLAWREVVRAKFGPGVAISDADVSRATSSSARRGEGPRVLISEILIPVTAGNLADKTLLADDLVAKVRSEGEFARAARRYSAAPSRLQGGQIGWIPLTNLPLQLRQMAVKMQPGQVSAPVQVAGAIAIIRMRGTNQGGAIKPGDVSVDFARLLIAGGRSDAALAEAARIRGEVDTCDDLYRVAKGLPADQLTRETRREAQLPADIAREIATLDDNEISTNLTSGNALVLLMLCRRTATQAADAATLEASAKADTATAVTESGEALPPIDPDLTFAKGPALPDMRSELVNQRLGQLAEAYLQDLKANAIIRTP